MKGYKGMKSDMTCLGMQYEIGKSFHVDGPIEVCQNGLHFCKHLNDVFDYYERDGDRFFEVEASGAIRSVRNKSVTSDLTIIRELEDVEINRIIYGRGYGNGDDYYGNGYGYSDDWNEGYGNGYDYGYGYDYDNIYGYGDGYGYGESINRILLFA